MSGTSDRTVARAILVWAVLVGAVLGAAVGYYLSQDRGLPFGGATLGSWLIISTLIYAMTSGVVAAGVTPVRLLFPKSDGVVGPPPYLSRAEALLARRQNAEAAAVFTEALDEDPDDHFALLALADLHARDPEEQGRGLDFLKRAIASGRLEPGTEAFQLRRLSEALLEGPSPNKAAPTLARLADRFPESAHGAWAAQTLHDLKSSMA